MSQGNKGKFNIYDCKKCGGVTVTQDVDDGVTPFMIGCRAKGLGRCKEFAQSRFYRVTPEDVDFHGGAQWEWYRPSPQALRGMGDEMFRHVARGGLDLRSIKPRCARCQADAPLVPHKIAEVVSYKPGQGPEAKDQIVSIDICLPCKRQTVPLNFKVGRNEACPCKSGKKYKKCHGR